MLGDAATLLGTGEPMQLYTLAYVLLLPYALLRRGSGVEAATGAAIVLAAHAFAAIAGGKPRRPGARAGVSVAPRGTRRVRALSSPLAAGGG